MKSPVPQFQDLLFFVSWWKAVMLVLQPMGAKKVNDAVPVLSTLMCLKTLPALLDCTAPGNILLAPWSTPQHSPAP